MARIPRWFYRAKNVVHGYYELSELLKKSVNTEQEKQELLDVIKREFVAFWKVLQDLLREKNIIEFYPRKIIKSAVKEGIIDKSFLIWIEYIDLLNLLLYANKRETTKLIDKIIKTYADEAENIYNWTSDKLKSFSPGKKMKHAKRFEYSKPKYSEQELGIYQNSYIYLLKFFQNTPEIKYVWFHGSRAKGDAMKNSDIDLLVDCPTENFYDIKSKINLLRIPYIIDISNINDESKTEFINSASEFAKMLYRKEDF